jgi:c-di-GMP-binding flagellar brake protein YcgR
MLAQTFSFWRRVVGKPAAEASGTGKEDRRLWVRYPADLKTRVQTADQAGAPPVPARVRDISRGGVNLLLDRSYRVGQMLSLEMPCPEEPGRDLYLLACVVHLAVEPSGLYSVGCVFSRELSEEDLYQFGARRVRHAPEDQRTWVRFACQQQVSYHKIGELEPRTHEAQLMNISASGVGLEVPEDVEIGALLNLHIVGKQGQKRTLLACVVHATRRDEGGWNLGCNFIRELSESDFQDLL